MLESFEEGKKYVVSKEAYAKYNDGYMPSWIAVLNMFEVEVMSPQVGMVKCLGENISRIVYPSWCVEALNEEEV